jgi:hypothetical protein
MRSPRNVMVRPRPLGFTTGMMARAIVAAAFAGTLASATVAGAEPPRAGDPGERAEALLLGGAINRFVAKQLPATFSIRGDRDAGIGAQEVTLVDARYCGAKERGQGRLIGVLRPAGEAPALPPLDGPDCRGKLEELARRLGSAPNVGAGAGAVAVVELLASWAPSELRVAIGDVATAGEGGRPLARTLTRAKAAGPLATADTSGLRLETERGSSLNLDVALSFLKGGDGVLATLTPACPGCAPAAPRAPVIANPAGAPADAEGIAAATLRFANRVVALYSSDGPLVLDVNRQDVEIRGLQLSAGEVTLALNGRATSRQLSESARISIEASGQDLKLTEVRAEAETEDCSALSGGASMRCSVRNAARGPAASALGAAMTARYRGQLLRTLVVPPPFSFEIGGRRMTLRLTPTRASAGAGSLIVHAKTEVE